TATVHFFSAGSALDKQKMTIVVFTVNVGVARRATLVAFRKDILRDPLTDPLIKHKVHSTEFTFEILLFYFLGILNNSTLKVMHIFKSFVLQVCAGFLAADAPGAIHHYFL